MTVVLFLAVSMLMQPVSTGARTVEGQDAADRRSVSADFDGDGRPDEARLVPGEAGQDWTLRVVLAADPATAHEVARGSARDWDRLGLSVVDPGDYASACSKGYGRSPCERRKVTLRRPGIELYSEESSAEYVWWTDGRFDSEPVSD